MNFPIIYHMGLLEPTVKQCAFQKEKQKSLRQQKDARLHI